MKCALVSFVLLNESVMRTGRVGTGRVGGIAGRRRAFHVEQADVELEEELLDLSARVAPARAEQNAKQMDQHLQLAVEPVACHTNRIASVRYDRGRG